jgi:phage terminase large subunit-like protein
MIIAADRKQARVIMRYIRGLLRAVPMLAATIEAERIESIDLNNRISIEVHTASFRTTRGYTVVAALLDEIAYWPSEDSTSPDFEIINAIRPAMATVPGAMMLCASSPHARRGVLWEAYHRHFGQESSSACLGVAGRHAHDEPDCECGICCRRVRQGPSCGRG